MKRGDAFIYLRNNKGHMCRHILKNALYVPTFKQNIFSVQAVTKNDTHISFEHDNYQLIYSFNVMRRHLYYVKNISARNATYNLHTCVT